uniref:Uncharacterized protein n=1 Tax=Enterovibrio norvegicus TaxID=188144 RepID=A0A0H4A2Y9_9GAMM|nr:hypothetical protein [Enterovibrio norvegicus]
MAKTFIASSEASLFDVLQTEAFTFNDVRIHCTFKRNKKDCLLQSEIKKVIERGLIEVGFTDGEILR